MTRKGKRTTPETSEAEIGMLCGEWIELSSDDRATVLLVCSDPAFLQSIIDIIDNYQVVRASLAEHGSEAADKKSLESFGAILTDAVAALARMPEGAKASLYYQRESQGLVTPLEIRRQLVFLQDTVDQAISGWRKIPTRKFERFAEYMALRSLDSAFEKFELSKSTAYSDSRTAPIAQCAEIVFRYGGASQLDEESIARYIRAQRKYWKNRQSEVDAEMKAAADYREQTRLKAEKLGKG